MKIIENFLEEEYFNRLTSLFCSTSTGFTWFSRCDGTIPNQPIHISDISVNAQPLNYFFTHVIYDKYLPCSPHYDLLTPFLVEIEKEEIEEKKLNKDKHQKLYGMRCLIRIRANYFPNTNTLHEYIPHTDCPYSHTAALLSLNTCDGYTKLVDGTKIDSVANRVVLFDAGMNHYSTTTSDTPARFNVIVNFLQ